MSDALAWRMPAVVMTCEPCKTLWAVFPQGKGTVGSVAGLFTCPVCGQMSAKAERGREIQPS